MTYQAFAHVYDRLMEDMPYEDWVHFLLDFCKQRSIQLGSVVDLGCGTGSIAIPLANRGLDVTGIDLSEDMLAVAQARREGRLLTKGSLRYIQQDMREWQIASPVDVVISFCDCLNYLTEPEDIIQTFKQTWQGLAPGGWFLFDVHSANTLEGYGLDSPFVLQDEDIAYIWTSDWDPERKEITHDLSIFVRDADERYDRIDECHVQRAYDKEWLQEVLRTTGFVEVRCYADFTFEAPDDLARRWFFAAQKPLESA